MEKSLKQRIQEALNLPESDFGNHYSDLYVIDQKGAVHKWLVENYKFHTNVRTFIGAKGSDWQGKICLDIPFAFGYQNERKSFV
jgi:hypothetical protein